MKTYWDRSGATRCARQQARERAPGDENQKARRPPGQKFHSRKKFSLSIGKKSKRRREGGGERGRKKKSVSEVATAIRRFHKQWKLDWRTKFRSVPFHCIPFASIAFRSLQSGNDAV